MSLFGSQKYKKKKIEKCSRKKNKLKINKLFLLTTLNSLYLF